MINFEDEMKIMSNTSKKVKLFLFLIALNATGFAVAHTYFDRYKTNQTEVVNTNQPTNSFKSQIESSSRIVQFGLEVLRLLKTSE